MFQFADNLSFRNSFPIQSNANLYYNLQIPEDSIEFPSIENNNNLNNTIEGFRPANEKSKEEVNFIINNKNKNRVVNFKQENNVLKEELRIEKEKNNELIEKIKNYEIEFNKYIEKINELTHEIEDLKNKFNIDKNYDKINIKQLSIHNGILEQKNIENEKEINNLKNTLENVNKDINNLKKENNEKNKKIEEMENNKNQNSNLIKKLKNQIISLNKKNGEEIVNLKREIGQLKLEKYNLNNKISQKDNDLLILKNKAKDKDIEIQNLKKKIKEKKREVDNSEKYKGEEMIVKFESFNGEIDYVIPCYSEDHFYILEEKLYEKFEKYRETDNFFIYDGRAILRYKTIKENKIDDSMPVMLYVFNKENSYYFNSFCLLSSNNRNNNNSENNQIKNGRNENK